MSTYTDYVVTLSPTWGYGYYGERFLGFSYGVMANVVAEGMSEAIRAPWLSESNPAPDAPAVMGSEMGMPKYPKESAGQYLDRLRDGWQSWEFAGTEATIENQFSLAGYTVELYEPYRIDSDTLQAHGDWLREPLDYWSHFWLLMPQDTHAFTVPERIGVTSYLIGGTGLVGEGLIGVGNATFEDTMTIRGIVNKWRPGHIICRQIIVAIDGDIIGALGLTIGDPGVVVGGESAAFSAN